MKYQNEISSLCRYTVPVLHVIRVCGIFFLDSDIQDVAQTLVSLKGLSTKGKCTICLCIFTQLII